MSFWKSLFGGASAGQAPSAPPREEYKGFAIEAMPIAEAGQFQIAGRITKEINGTRQEHSFRRADRFSSQDEAVNFTFVKARQIIDQGGDRLFG
jgi:hypothetical protein